MNKLVTPEIKQLLFDKGWRYELSEIYDPEIGGTRVMHSLGEQRWNEGDLSYVDITIVEIVMWLYEKHGIWIYPFRHDFNNQFYWHIDTAHEDEFTSDNVFNSPTEAYEEAIKYTLTKLI